MKSLQIVTTVFATTFTFSAMASAQLGPLPRQGFASALANGHRVSTAPSAVPSALFIKAPGDATSAPMAWSAITFPTGPNYSPQAMFPALAGLVHVDGHSSGNDDIPWFTFDSSSNHWIPELGSVRWMQLAVSVNNGASGTAGSLIRQRTQLSHPDRNTPGSDVIGYYFQGSAQIDPNLRGQTLLEQSSEQIGYSLQEDINALDWGIGVQTTSSSSITPEILFTRRNEYYFTISKDSAFDINAYFGATSTVQFAVFNGAQLQADGAAIYKMVWSDSTWSQPELYRSPAELGLIPGVDELDALAVNPLNGTTIFSTQYIVGFSQLQVHMSGWTTSEPLWDNGDFVARHIGSTDDGDDIDSVAIIDPGIESPFSIFATHLGTPIENQAASSALPNTMGLSVTRGHGLLGSQTDAETQHEWLIAQASGWGSAVPQKGVVTLHYALDFNPSSPQTAKWLFAGTQPRLPEDEVTTFQIQLPDWNTSSSGQSIAYTAVLWDQASQPCSLSLISVIAAK